MYYFNPAAWGGGISYAKLPYRTKRLVTHSRICELPARYQVKDGALHIPSFASIKEGEDFFQDAHQYFNLLSRGREAYSEVAKRLGDEVFLTDNELFDAVCTLCRTRFDIAKPPQLGAEDKIQVALQMKQSWHASNGQIRRILKLDDRVVKHRFHVFPEFGKKSPFCTPEPSKKQFGVQNGQFCTPKTISRRFSGPCRWSRGR